MTQVLRQEYPMSKKVERFVLRNCNDFVTRTCNGILFIMGRRLPFVRPAGYIPKNSRYEEIRNHYFVPIIARESAVGKAIARQYHDNIHSKSVAMTLRDIRFKYYIPKL